MAARPLVVAGNTNRRCDGRLDSPHGQSRFACSVGPTGRTGGPADDKPGYEGSGFWARSSAAWQHGSGSEYPPLIQPGFGDHTTSLSMVGGVLAALLAAKTTGKGQVVETSLMRTGIYCNGWGVQEALHGKPAGSPAPRAKAGQPTIKAYTCAPDPEGGPDRIFLFGLETDRHWPPTA